MRCIHVYMTEVFSVRLDTETKQRLDHLSDATQRPASVYAREAINRYIDDLEDYYLAHETLERTRATREAYTPDQVIDLLGLHD